MKFLFLIFIMVSLSVQKSPHIHRLALAKRKGNDLNTKKFTNYRILSAVEDSYESTSEPEIKMTEKEYFPFKFREKTSKAFPEHKSVKSNKNKKISLHKAHIMNFRFKEGKSKRERREKTYFIPRLIKKSFKTPQEANLINNIEEIPEEEGVFLSDTEFRELTQKNQNYLNSLFFQLAEYDRKPEGDIREVYAREFHKPVEQEKPKREEQKPKMKIEIPQGLMPSQPNSPITKISSPIQQNTVVLPDSGVQSTISDIIMNFKQK